MAAVLSGSPGTVLSHRSAAALWEIRPHHGGRAEVTFRRQVHGSAGMLPHKASLPEDEITRLDGIPVTTVARTIFDLAAVLDCSRVERALSEAEVCGLGGVRLRTWATLSGTARNRLHPAARACRRGGGADPQRARGAFLALLGDHGLPQPLVNAGLHVGGRWYEADCLWREQQLVVELDGQAVHATSRAFERDRVRDRTLQVAGWRVVRITWRRLAEDPETVVADLRRLLA
jgi:REase_MTES_1575